MSCGNVPSPYGNMACLVGMCQVRAGSCHVLWECVKSVWEDVMPCGNVLRPCGNMSCLVGMCGNMTCLVGNVPCRTALLSDVT